MASFEKDLDSLRSFSRSQFEIEGAMPSIDIAQVASNFIERVKFMNRRPEISCDPQGTIEFEWFESHEHTVLVSIGAESISWSARLNGSAGQKGTVRGATDLPDELRSLLSRY